MFRLKVPNVLQIVLSERGSPLFYFSERPMVGLSVKTKSKDKNNVAKERLEEKG